MDFLCNSLDCLCCINAPCITGIGTRTSLIIRLDYQYKSIVRTEPGFRASIKNHWEKYNKMAASVSIAEELLSAINTDYTSNVHYLNLDKVIMDTALFEDTELAKQYHLDTSTCVSGHGKHRRINVNNLYDIFESYSLDDAATVKSNTLAEIDQNPECYQEAGHIIFVMKGTTFKKWLESMHRPHTRPDELMLYVLCVLYCCHCVVYTKWQPWHTVNPNSLLIW